MQYFINSFTLNDESEKKFLQKNQSEKEKNENHSKAVLWIKWDIEREKFVIVKPEKLFRSSPRRTN